MTSLTDLHKGITPKATADNVLKRLHSVADIADAIISTPESPVAEGYSVSTKQKADFTNFKLLPFTDTRLTTKPAAFDFENPNYLEYADSPLEFAEALFDRMLRLGGVGLSANQIGIPLRAFVFGNHTTRNYVFNPQVVGVSDETSLMEERCLSFPGFALTLRRPKQCGVTFQTETGGWFVSTLDNLAARIFLHEFDHMEGTTFLQWASKEKIDWELQKVNKRLNKLKKNKKLQLQPKRPNGKSKKS